MIIIYNQNIPIDITKYVDPLSVQVTKTIDGLYNQGSFVITAINGTIGGLDFSRAIPRYSRVMVDGDYFRIGESDVIQQGKYWRHEVTLTSAKKVLSRKSLPNMTLTQPQGNIGNYYRSGNNLNLSGAVPFVNSVVTGYKTQGIEIKQTNKEIPYNNTTPSTDTTILSVRTLREIGTEYNINLYLDIYNVIATTIRNPLPEVEVWVTIGANEVYREKRTMANPKFSKLFGLIIVTSAVYPGQWVINKSFVHTPLVPNEEVKVFVKGYGRYKTEVAEYDMVYYAVDSQLSIYTKKNETVEVKYLDYWGDKLLRLSGAKIRLDDNSRARLKTILSPEWTYNEYDLGTSINEIANSVGAIATIESFDLDENGFTDILKFNFYDEMERYPRIDMPYHTKSRSNDLENYVSELELNAENLISDRVMSVPFLNGWMSLRALNPNTQIDTANICVKAPLGIYVVTKFMVKGLSIVTANRTVTEHDITRRVLNREKFDALPKASDYSVSGRLFTNINQNSAIFYIEGDDTIYNMGGTGTTPPAFTGVNRSNRAIFECCAAEVAEQYGEVVTNWDNGLSINDNIEIYFEYRSFGKTRASVFKEDQSGFVERLTKYFNESARVNDPLSLGNSAQSIVNRLGNTKISQIGEVDSKEELAIIGGLNQNDEKLVSIRTSNLSNGRISYVATYIKDYNVLSDFVGIKSQIRQWETPSTNLVERNDKRIIEITVGLGSLGSQPTFYLNILKNDAKVVPTFARIRFERGENDFIDIGAPVNEIVVGETITWNVKMKDNYSAGSRKIKQTIAGVETTWDEEVRYTNLFGQVHNVLVGYYTRFKTMTLSEKNKYPEIDPSSINGTKLLEYTYNCDKDAREIWNHTLQRIYLGANNVVVYNLGLETYDTALAVFHYIPSKQAQNVDLSRVTTLSTNTTVVTADNIEVTLPLGVTEGYGWYDRITNKLIMFVKGNPGGVQIIPYRGRVI